MSLNLQAIAQAIRQSSTEELLDRVTVYREGMEPAALDLMEGELSRRGVTKQMIEEHESARQEQGLVKSDGLAWPCSWCNRPAIESRWGWFRLGGRWFRYGLPLFPWRWRYCAKHHPKPPASTEDY